jgi:hypothetical protein
MSSVEAVRTFCVARNPDPDSSLPYLISLPLSGTALVLKARDTWPRTAKVYCHRCDEWPESLDIIEEVPVRSCVRRGVAIDLVLDRARENRSQVVFTRMRNGREGIFWQSTRTTRQRMSRTSWNFGDGLIHCQAALLSFATAASR